MECSVVFCRDMNGGIRKLCSVLFQKRSQWDNVEIKGETQKELTKECVVRVLVTKMLNRYCRVVRKQGSGERKFV
jgi:hypothetical protein